MIDPFNKYKVLASYGKVRTLIDGGIPSPKTAEFFLSDKCNHSCVGCHSKGLWPAFLDWQVAKSALDELAGMGVESVEISGGGEPLLYPHMSKFVKHARLKGLPIGLITNLSVLDSQLAGLLVKNLAFVRVALDASSASTYKLIHGVDSFEKLKENVRLLVSRKKDFMSKVTIGLKFLVSRLNKKEIKSAVALARTLGVDYIQFKALRNSEHELSKVESDECEKIIDFLRGDFQVLGSVRKTSLQGRCYLAPLHPLVDADGKVYLCAHFQYRKSSHVIGDLTTQHFSDFWGKEKHKQVLKTVRILECNVYDCPLHEPNKVAEQIEKDDMHLEFI